MYGRLKVYKIVISNIIKKFLLKVTSTYGLTKTSGHMFSSCLVPSEVRSSYRKLRSLLIHNAFVYPSWSCRMKPLKSS